MARSTTAAAWTRDRSTSCGPSSQRALYCSLAHAISLDAISLESAAALHSVQFFLVLTVLRFLFVFDRRVSCLLCAVQTG